MKVSSPVGDFPFRPTRVRVVDRGLVVEGEMGAWPASVRLDTGDIPTVLRLVPTPALAALGGLTALLLGRAITHRRTDRA